MLQQMFEVTSTHFLCNNADVCATDRQRRRSYVAETRESVVGNKATRVRCPST